MSILSIILGMFSPLTSLVAPLWKWVPRLFNWVGDYYQAKNSGESAQAAADIEVANQQYGDMFVRDGRTVVALIALACIIAFIMDWLPANAYSVLPPIIMEMCKWVELYLGLTVGSSAAITALNVWGNRSLRKTEMQHRHEINLAMVTRSTPKDIPDAADRPDS